MDPSTSSAQDVQKQKASDPGVATVQQPAAPVQTPHQQQPSKTSVTISVGKEGSPAVIAAENPNSDEDDEEELAAPQEKKMQVVSQRGGAVQEEEIVDIGPSVPEVSASAEVEKVIEKTLPEEPKISPELKKVGVTHSGPGVIPSSISVSENNFGIKNLPESFEQAAEEEKTTKLHDSKHWFSAMIMYIWRRLNPQLGKQKTVTSAPSVSTTSPAPTSTAGSATAQPVQKPLPEPEPEPDANVVEEEEEDQKELTSV